MMKKKQLMITLIYVQISNVPKHVIDFTALV